MNIKVINPPFGENTAIQFVDRTDLSETNLGCGGILDQEGTSNIYGYTVLLGDTDARDNCDWLISVRIYL